MLWLNNTAGVYTLRLRAETGNGDNSSYVSVEKVISAPATDGTWYVYRGSLDLSAGTGKIFIDGVDQSAGMNNVSPGTTINNEDAPLLVGALMNSGTPVSFLDGVIDAVVVANTYTATASEPLNVTPSTTYISNMAGLWNFNGSSYADGMPAGNDLTGVNSPTFVDGYPFQL